MYGGDDDDDDTVMDVRHHQIGRNAHLPTNAEVEALRSEVERLRDMLNVASTGASEARYFELHKKHRELNVKYETERARANKLMAQIAQREKEQLEAEAARSTRIVLPSQRLGAKPAPLDAQTAIASENEVLFAETEELKSKLDRALKSNAALRKTNDELKRDVARMKKIVALELGEDADAAMAAITAEGDGDGDNPPSPGGASTVNNGPRSQSAGNAGVKPGASAGWRSRAQQIALLKSKTKDLARQLTASRQAMAAAGIQMDTHFDAGEGDFDAVTIRSAMTGAKSAVTGVTAMSGVTATTATKRDFDDVNRSIIERKEQKRMMDTRDMERVVTTLKEEATKEKSRADALQARLGNLERDNQHLRLCVSRLVEKTENDDALIETYRQELETQREEFKKAVNNQTGTSGPIAGRRATTANRESQLQNEVARLQDVVTDLRRQVASLQQQQQQQQASSPTAKSKGPFAGSSPIDALFDTSSAKQTQQQQQQQQAPPRGQKLPADLAEAWDVIQAQRDTILTFERHLQKSDKAVEAARRCLPADIPTLIREENTSLKERITTLTNVMEREITLYKAAAEEAKAAASRQSTLPQLAGPLPVSRGRPPSASSGRTGSAEGTSRSAAGPSSGDGTVPSTPDAAEVARLKQQYNDLKKAYNAMAMKVSNP